MKSTFQSGDARNPALSRAIDGLWERFLPEIRERVAVLEEAIRFVADCKLTAEQRGAAQAAAHKLSGTLGTFGLTRGTALARELEIAFAGESPRLHVAGANLATIAAELRTLIESRKPSA